MLNIKNIYQLFCQVKESKEIVVVGGGPAGVEIATEIASTYSDKKVTVVQGSGQLIHKTAPPNFIGRIDELLKQMNVTVILGKLSIHFRIYIKFIY